MNTSTPTHPIPAHPNTRPHPTPHPPDTRRHHRGAIHVPPEPPPSAPDRPPTSRRTTAAPCWPSVSSPHRAAVTTMPAIHRRPGGHHRRERGAGGLDRRHDRRFHCRHDRRHGCARRQPVPATNRCSPRSTPNGALPIRTPARSRTCRASTSLLRRRSSTSSSLSSRVLRRPVSRRRAETELHHGQLHTRGQRPGAVRLGRQLHRDPQQHWRRRRVRGLHRLRQDADRGADHTRRAVRPSCPNSRARRSV